MFWMPYSLQCLNIFFCFALSSAYFVRSSFNGFFICCQNILVCVDRFKCSNTILDLAWIDCIVFIRESSSRLIVVHIQGICNLMRMWNRWDWSHWQCHGIENNDSLKRLSCVHAYYGTIFWNYCRRKQNIVACDMWETH